MSNGTAWALPEHFPAGALQGNTITGLRHDIERIHQHHATLDRDFAGPSPSQRRAGPLDIGAHDRRVKGQSELTIIFPLFLGLPRSQQLFLGCLETSSTLALVVPYGFYSIAARLNCSIISSSIYFNRE